jgi:putative ABC transport system permease protein
MDKLLQDIRYALRAMRRTPGFTAVALLTLALGIGANAAIFSVINAVLLRPLPFPDPDRVLRVYSTFQGERGVLSPRNFLDVREQQKSFASLAAYYADGYTLSGAGDPERLDGATVSADFFGVLGVKPLVGRTFRPDEDVPGKNRVAVLGYDLWRRRFGGDRGIVGRAVTLEGVPYVVVGVMPAGFAYPEKREIWTPIPFDSSFTGQGSRGAYYISAIGRLAPGATPEHAAVEVAGIAGRLARAYPEANANVGGTALPLAEALVGDIRGSLLVLLAAVGFVMLIACANLANLLLSRAAARQGEMAVRVALGAGRRRLIRQLLTESVALSLAGAALGLVLARWGAAFLVSMKPRGIPRLEGVGVDATVVAYTAGIAVLTGILFGLAPALQAARGQVATALREGGRSPSASRGSARMRGALVVAEMALAVMLLAGAGLLIRSFATLRAVNPGFRTDRALTFRIAVPESRYGRDAQIDGFYSRLLATTAALPGAAGVGAVSALPLSGTSFNFDFTVDGRPKPPPGASATLETRAITPGYLTVMGIPVLRGRGFTEADRAGAPPVVLISQSAARKFFAGEDPIGKRIVLGWTRTDTVHTGGTVVGVVGDVKLSRLEDEAPPHIYLAHHQVPTQAMSVVLRGTGDPLSLAPAVRRTVAALDPDVPVTRLLSVSQLVSDSVSQRRFYMLLLTLFAALALALAGVGIFGVVSYTVVQRTREIGIRMALGAAPGRVLHEVVGRGVGLAGIGLGVGLVLSLGATRTLAGLLYGVGPQDPATLAATLAVLGGAALAASWIPARRATRVDPITALRAD